MSPIVTVSGDLGSGKTEVSKALASMLGYKYISTGQLHRDIAAEMGMNSLELNLHAEGDPAIDERVDAALLGLSNEGVSYVIDSRMAWHFVPNSLKIYLTADPDVASLRVMADTARLNEPAYQDQQTAKVQLLARKESERRRFLEKYGVDCEDLGNYDAIIDSTLLLPKQVVELLSVLIERWRGNLPFARHWTSPRLLFPTEHVRQLGTDVAKDLRARIECFGFDPECPIEVVVCEDFFYIWNGHKRASSALLAKKAAVPIFMLAQDKERLPHDVTVEEFVASSINLTWYYDWEDVHGFLFTKYPAQVEAEAGRGKAS